MIDSIIKNLAPNVISKLTKDFNLNTDQASQAVETTQSSLVGSITKEVTAGNTDGLLSLLNSGTTGAGSSVFHSMVTNLAGDYAKKLGIPGDTAQKIADFVLPLVINKVSSQIGGNADKGDLMKLVSSGAGGMLKNTLGGLFK